MKQVGEVGLRRWLGFAGDLGTWGNFTHRLDGDKGDGTVALSIVAGVARPPRVVFLRGDESEIRPTAEVVRPPCIVLSWW